MSLRNFKTIQARRTFIEQKKEVNLDALSVYPADLDSAGIRNCENMIGAVSVPVGIAGPLPIFGAYASGKYFIPLATTEAALVASVNRGCKAIEQSGSATSWAENVGITRGPVFVVSGIQEGRRMIAWLHAHEERIGLIAAETSTHLRMASLHARVIGKNVFVRFAFDTQDAMGMNMATFAVQNIVKYIEENTHARCVSIAGNFDVDKKPSWLNALWGRGKRIHAEAEIARSVVGEVLKTTPESIHDVWCRKCLIGSVASGAMGSNAHHANVITALFLAAGQDVAHVAEGSIGMTTTDINTKGLYIAVTLPDMPLGTVGGGTALPAQQACLRLLGVAGGNEGKNASALAEIVGAAVLAGELSLLASLAQGSLAHAHRTLTRRE